MTAPQQTGKVNKISAPPYKVAAVVLLVVAALVVAAVYVQFQGGFTAETRLTMVSGRAGLVMNPARRSPTTACRSAR